MLPLRVDDPSAEYAWLHIGLAEMIRGQLGQAPGCHVIARHRIAAALAAAGRDEAQDQSREAATRIVTALGAERMVTGRFARRGERFDLEASVVELPSGRTQATATASGRVPGEILDAVQSLCLDLLHQLAPGEVERRPAWRPTQLGTRSIAAYRHYVEAVTWFARGGEAGAREAEACLDQALLDDPGFALAYLKKAEILNWRRQWGYGDPDPAPAVREALRLSGGLPDRERQLAQGFDALILRQAPQEALKSWDALLQYYPTYAQEVGVPGLVVSLFLREGRWDDMILVGEAHVDSPSLPDADRALLASLLAQAYRRKGSFDRALVHARRAAQLWPTGEGPRFLFQRTTLGRIALEAGRRDEALSEFRAVAASPDADVTNLTDAAWGLYMAGETEAAASQVERAIRRDESYGNAYHLRGWLQLAAGDYAAAAASLEQAFARTPPSFGNPHQGNVGGDLAALYYAGVAYQKADRAGQAAQAFRRLMDDCRRTAQQAKGGAPAWQARSFLARAAARLGVSAPDPGPLADDEATYLVQTARLHAVQGKRAQALDELTQGLALGHGEYRHVLDDPDFESLRGEPAFRAAVADHVPR